MSDQDERNAELVPFVPDRARVDVNIDSMVVYSDHVYRVSQVLDFKTVIGIDVESGRAAALPIAALKPVPREKVDGLYVNYDIGAIAAQEWAIAQTRFAAIQPLLGNVVVGRKEVEKRAKEVNVAAATLYRWLEKYRTWGELLALIPRKRGWQWTCPYKTGHQLPVKLMLPLSA